MSEDSGMDRAAKILVVDDDPMMVRLTSRLLQRAGYRVTEAASGREALRLTREEAPDLVILDVVMPGVDGVEVCRRIKGDDALEGISVILLSGVHTASESQAAGLEAGADDYIARPVANQELLARVKALLRLKSTQEALRRSEHRFRSFIEQSHDAIVLTDEEGLIVEWNPAAERIFGWEREDVLGRAFWDVQFETLPQEQRTPASRERLKAEMLQVLETGSASWLNQAQQIEAERPDGERRIFEMISFSIETESGFRVGGVSRDVTQRSRADEKARFQARLLDAVGQAIIVTDPNGTIIFWNHAAEQLYGWKEDEALGCDVTKITPTEASREQAVEIMASLRAGERWVGEFAVVRRDGTAFPAIVSDTPVHDEDGNLVAIIGVTTDISEQKRIEEKLRESEIRFRQLFDRMGTGAAIYRAEDDGEHFIIQDINRLGEQISQVSREEVVGKRLREVFPGVEDLGLFETLQEVYRTGQPRDLPVAQYRDERISHWVDNYVYQLPSGEVVAVYEDVTERKRMEEALRESEERYRSLYNSIRDAILVADTERHIIDCNPAFSDLFGYTLEEIEGKKTYTVYESREEFEQLGEALRDHIGDPSFLFTVQYRKKSGEVFPGETNVFYLRNDKGEVTGFIGLIRDVTERGRMERELRESQERYRNLVESQGEGIGIVAPDETFVFANPAAHDIFGVDPGSLVGRSLEEFLDEEGRAVIAAQTERRQAGEESTYEVDIVRPDGEKRTLLVTANPREDEEGRFEATFAVFRDVTRRREMERALRAYSERLEDMVEERTRELREAQEKLLRNQKLVTLGQLAGSINHELRGPLGNIQSGAYFLKMALEEPEEDVQETLDLMEHEVNRAESIIRSLLNFVRTEEPRRQVVDVNDLINDLLDEVEMPEEVEVVPEMDQDVPTISADPEHLRQVFRNLISNAVEAMPEGGRLTVSSGQSSAIADDWIRVTISDTGEGIPPEVRERIFEPLFSTKSDGVGLGLPLAQMLVEAHGGEIEMESEAGKGTTFTVRLPRPEGQERSEGGVTR